MTQAYGKIRCKAENKSDKTIFYDEKIKYSSFCERKNN